MFGFVENVTINDNFSDFDFGRYLVINLGSLFIIGNVILVQFPIYYCAKWCCDETKCGKAVQKYYQES